MYESWFRFRRRPFAAAPRVDDYYPAESSESARKSLIACVQRGAGPGLLIGATGSGKSTLCHQLLCHFRTRTAVATISCSGLAARRALFQNILFELGRPYRDLDEGELRLSLVDYLTSRDAAHAGTVLLFDDAHYLSPELFEDLRMLCGMVRDGHWCVHVVLAGTIRLEEILAVPNLESLHQRIAARCYLEPFRLRETAAYVRRQFERVDGKADEVFVAGALTAIHQCSGGTPRLINQLCDHALLLAATGGRSQLDEHGICEAWSDLQHLPPPENESQTALAVNEIVEFGSLDHEPSTPFDGTVVEITENEQGSARESESQQVPLADRPVAPSPDTEPVAPSADLSHGQETEFDANPQADDVETFDLQPSDSGPPAAERFAGTPVDAERQLDAIEAQLECYDDQPHFATENPFLENFAEEEVIIDRPSSLLNRVVDCQPHVSSRQGRELSRALDEFSLSEAMGQPWQLASESDTPQVSVATADRLQREIGRGRNEADTRGYLLPDFASANCIVTDGEAEYAGIALADAALEAVAAMEDADTAQFDVPAATVPEVGLAEEVAGSEFAVSEDDVNCHDAAPAGAGSGEEVNRVKADLAFPAEVLSELAEPELPTSDEGSDRGDAFVTVPISEVVVLEVDVDVDCEDTALKVDNPHFAADPDEMFVEPDQDLVEHACADANAGLIDPSQIEIQIDGHVLDEEPAHEPLNHGMLPNMEEVAELDPFEKSKEQTGIFPPEAGPWSGDDGQDATVLEGNEASVDSKFAGAVSNVLLEMHSPDEHYQVEVRSPMDARDAIEVFEVQSTELPAAAFHKSVGQNECELLAEQVAESSAAEVFGNGEKSKKGRQPLPRDATPGGRLNRLFSSLLADR